MAKKEIRLNLMLDEETAKLSKILRNDYNINISSLIRNVIKQTYNKVINENNQIK